jgi:hypothetical protein
MDTPLPAHDPVRTARALMDRYGLRAAAMAEQRAAEAEAAGEPAELDHWRSVSSAIAELRRTRPTAH